MEEIRNTHQKLSRETFSAERQAERNGKYRSRASSKVALRSFADPMSTLLAYHRTRLDVNGGGGGGAG